MSPQWTVMVYIAGIDSLSGTAPTDRRDMQKVGSTEQVKVAAIVSG